MKFIYTTWLLFLVLSSSCSTSPAGQDTGDSSSSQVHSSNTDSDDPEWPYPEWNADRTIAIDKGTDIVFKADKLTDFALRIPDDWERIANRASSLLYKSPTVNSLFANFGMRSDNPKPNPIFLVNQKKEFDYSAFEPEAALRDFLQKKIDDPASGRIQQLEIDGVSGVLEQIVYKAMGNSNSPTRPPEGIWQWTTFMKNKNENNKIIIFVSYPLPEMDKFTRQIAGLVNSAKIKRTDGIGMIVPRDERQYREVQ